MHIEAAWIAEEERYTDACTRFITKYPEWRKHFACCMLGAAVAFCDTFGVDPLDWIIELRKHHPLPAVLNPPKDKQS
jgi:hypothetical protein